MLTSSLRLVPGSSRPTTPPVVSAVPKVVYLLTTDTQRVDDMWLEAERLGLRLEVLFPKELPMPADAAAAVVIDLDYLWMDEHEKRRYVTHQLFQPLHPVAAVVSRTLDWHAVPLHKKPNLGGFRKLDLGMLHWLDSKLRPAVVAAGSRKSM